MRYIAFATAWFIFVSVFDRLGPFGSVYIGAERCRLCHRAIYQSWTRTAHYRATERISEEERSHDCLRCHATGPESLVGVQCEACHGAGGNYWPAAVMMDPQKAREAGLIEPKESICRRCHGSGLPSHSFDFSMPSGADLPRTVHEW